MNTNKLDNSILNIVCEVVSFDNPKQNLKLAQGLFKLMVKENGIGLAANQAGINQRVFVMNVNNKAYHCFNPSIVEMGNDLVDYREGCLSFPKEYCNIFRPDRIIVKYYNAFGHEVIEEMTGITSRCFQHELDHLNGVTMHDRVTKL